MGVLKTKTPKTPKTPKTLKLENKDPPYFGVSEITTSRSPMRLKVERWDKNFERGIKILNLLLAVFTHVKLFHEPTCNAFNT